MHILEAKKERIATGRLSSLCLNNSEIIVGIDFTNNTRVNYLLSDPRYYPLVLYPGNTSYNISDKSLDKMDLKGKTPLIFVIDGTWPCAKKMMRLSLNINDLPRICFTPQKKSRFSIKQQPHQDCVSTIESIHVLLSELDKWGIESLDDNHNHLLDVLDQVVKFQFECANSIEMPSYRMNCEHGKSRGKMNYKTNKARGIFFK